jgi:hypothetical protein
LSVANGLELVKNTGRQEAAMNHIQRALSGVAAGALCLASCGHPTAEPAHRVIRMMAGQPGNNSILDSTIAAVRSLPGVQLELRESPGGLRSVQALQNGEGDIAFSGADVAYLAFAGLLEGTAHPFDQLRGIAVLPMVAVHLIARRDSGIHSIGDLKGRHISVGGPGSAGSLTSRLILEAFGVEASTYDAEMIEFNDALGRIVDGRLDALFVNLRFPDERIRRAIGEGAYIVPLEGPPLEQMRRAYPFFKFALIPASSYSLQEPVHTMGIDGILLCRRDVDETIAYELTKRLLETVMALPSYKGSFFDRENAPATPIPLHDGAARFYREEELRR